MKKLLIDMTPRIATLKRYNEDWQGRIAGIIEITGLGTFHYIWENPGHKGEICVSKTAENNEEHIDQDTYFTWYCFQAEKNQDLTPEQVLIAHAITVTYRAKQGQIEEGDKFGQEYQVPLPKSMRPCMSGIKGDILGDSAIFDTEPALA